MFSLLSWALLALVPLPLRGEENSLGNAQVTIPYAELKSLLDRADANGDRSETPPPVAAVLTAAEYRLDFSTLSPAFSASFEARGFAEGWHSVPLFGGGARIVSEDSDKGVSVVLSEGQRVSLLANGTGVFSSRLVLTVPPREDWSRGNGFEFLPAPATRNELRVSGLPDDRTLQIEGVPGKRDEASGDLVFHLPGDGEELRLVLEERTEAVPDAPISESRWTLHSQVAVRYEDGRLFHQVRIQAQASSGSGLSMALAFPPQVSRVEIEGDDLRDWTLGAREEDGRVARIHWQTRDVLDRSLLVSWEIPQSPLAESWTLAPPVARFSGEPEADAAEDDSRTLFALVPVEGLELTHPDLAATVEAQRLPKWLQAQLGGAESLSAEVRGTAPIALAATWLPRMETAQATISQASFETRLVADGSTLVMADYVVHHAAPLSWKLLLPSAEQILTCEVNDASARPIRRSDDEIEFRLSAPRPLGGGEGEESGQGTTVHLCYALRSDPLDPVSGRVDLELPQTDLFIHRLDWELQIPERYEATAVEGNVQIAPGKETRGILLKKELCRGERPAVELYYQRKDLN